VRGLADRVKDQGERLQTRVREVVGKALQSRVGEDPSWDGFLVGLGLKPLAAARRLELSSQGVPNLKGALPIEVRKALDAIRRQSERDLEPLVEELTGPGTDDDGDAEGCIDRLRRDLAELVDREMQEYLVKCRPKVTLSSIFANAQMTSVRLGDAAPDVKARKCTCCGAARPEGTDLRSCAFCGNDFFAVAAV